MRILIGITGASGSIYGIRLIEELKKNNMELHLILSEEAEKIIEYETEYNLNQLDELITKRYNNIDLFAPPSSGSFKLDSMIISPCSIKSLSSIANGYCNNLISRSAICCLKEGRKLIIVIRETPLDLTTIENMRRAKLNGAIILPAMPAFYHSPKKIDDIVNYVVGKILDQINIEHNLFNRWK
jgi:4-hydroxy-3-polyprenylbenzoate decarboxylase